MEANEIIIKLPAILFSKEPLHGVYTSAKEYRQHEPHADNKKSKQLKKNNKICKTPRRKNKENPKNLFSTCRKYRTRNVSTKSKRLHFH
ncbi:hypothetical protein M832_02170 [Chlamydia avium 10DC88]|uniref:Uncharacterized protein n=1 Tax=Chlamydia avium 10DC88 TaxID=1229831 RepID=W8JET6_9CHLA|nr:hypothetical protein M832_02170 [Chlamydia avium 10DC88]